MSAPEPGLEIQAAARLLAEGRSSEATLRLEPLVEAAPAYAAALVLLARAYESEGRPSDSLGAWHRAHFLVPTSPLVRRERQRLLDAGVEAPPPPPKPAPAADFDSAGVAETDAPPDGDVPDSPMDAIFIEEDRDTATATGDLPGGWTSVSDAPPPIESTQPDGELAPIDWMVDADVGRAAGVVPADPGEGEPVRLFSEDAFDHDEVFEADAVPVGGDVADEQEGWAVLDETDERATEPDSTPMEADIAPPPGFAPPAYWSVVPTKRAERPPLAEEDLDSLIRQIEDAPRIKPDPHFVPPATLEVEPAAREDEDVVSETLARIYASQGQFGEAASVYEKLALQRPADAETFRQRASEMRERAAGGT